MKKIHTSLKALILVAVGMLMLNDCVRLVFSFQDQIVSTAETSEESNNVGSMSLLEEELKHKDLTPRICIELSDDASLNSAVAHLIKDDEVRHLAYLAIFSPPPDLG